MELAEEIGKTAHKDATIYGTLFGHRYLKTYGTVDRNNCATLENMSILGHIHEFDLHDIRISKLPNRLPHG